ncbi:MAG: DUF2911 domain-containing protein [Ferruginibacter sp.]
MKKGLLIVVSFLSAGLFYGCQQQANKVTVKPDNQRIPVSVNDSMILSIDRSSMDMSYFPEDYPKQKMMTPDLPNPVARVIYSRPQKNGRIIFADTSVTQNVIQHYGQEWRLGANEATEIEFFKPVSIYDKKIAAGRYILYCIPYPDKWKVVFNNNLFSWGLHIDKTKDLAEVELPVIKNNVQIEFFTMFFQNSTYGCDLVMAWGDMKAVMPVNFK